MLISRVESSKGLRIILQYDRDGLESVRQQMLDQYMHAWERAYTDTGDWSDDRAVAALHNIRNLRIKEKQAAAEEMGTQPSTNSLNVPASKRRLPQMTPEHSKPRAKKLSRCSICQSPDHTREKCTTVTRSARETLLSLNSPASKRRLPPMTPEHSKPQAKKVYRCSICRSPDHRRDKCTAGTTSAKEIVII